jgi:hypothetical protein
MELNSLDVNQIDLHNFIKPPTTKDDPIVKPTSPAKGTFLHQNQLSSTVMCAFLKTNSLLFHKDSVIKDNFHV